MKDSTLLDRTLRRFGACSATACFLWALSIYSTHYRGRGNIRAVDAGSDSILITGARSGIGRHAALTMNHLGFTVFAGVRNRSQDEGVDELLKRATHPEKMVLVQLDVTEDADIRSAIKTIEGHVGEKGLTAVFHSAGLVPSLPTGDDVPRREKSLSVEVAPLETFRDVMEVEYFGAIAVTKACLGLLERYARYANGREGTDGQTKSADAATARIVFNSDAKTAIPYTGHTFGPLFATHAVATSLRYELLQKGTGVDVITMQPGAIKTKSLIAWLDTARSAEFSDHYSPMEQRTMRAIVEETAATAVTAEATSDALVQAVLSSKPFKNYYPGHMAYMGYIAGHWFPDSWLDLIFANIKDKGKFNDSDWIEKARNEFQQEDLPPLRMMEKRTNDKKSEL